MGLTWATSPPFHVYSRTWDCYPGRGRTPEKLGDVSKVKKEDPATCPLLLPNRPITDGPITVVLRVPEI
jgi:hypothetical protein